jgi:hypothetical protein
MAEAKINGIIRQRTAADIMPTAADMAAMEAMSARFASALLQEGRVLPGPNPDQSAKMLALLSAARVLARLGMDEGAAAAGMQQAVRLALRQEIAAAGRKLLDEVEPK